MVGYHGSLCYPWYMPEVTCPFCNNSVEADIGPAVCPACGQSIEVIAEEEVELDGNRIQRISHARRSEVRARAYSVIGGFVVFGGSSQLVWMGIRAGQAGGWTAWAIGCIVAGAVGIGLALRLWLKK